MLGILTFIVGLIFVALVCNAILHTFIGIGKIILGLILMGFSYICDAASWLNLNVRNIWYHLTVSRTNNTTL